MKFDINPKNGWKNATPDELQQFFCNEIGDAHKINPQSIYKVFESLGIELVTCSHLLMGENTNKSNPFLLAAILGGDSTWLKNYLGITLIS